MQTRKGDAKRMAKKKKQGEHKPKQLLIKTLYTKQFLRRYAFSIIKHT